MLAKQDEVSVSGEKLKVVLDSVLCDQEIRDPYGVNAVLQACDLHLNQVVPIRGDRMSLDFLQQCYETDLSAKMEWGDEFGQNQVVRDYEILLNQKFKGL